MKNPLEVGQIAVVRQRPYVVKGGLGQGIASSVIKEFYAEYLVKLSSADDDSPREELEVIWGAGYPSLRQMILDKGKELNDLNKLSLRPFHS